MARESGIPIQPWAVAIRPALRLNGRWDKHLVPLPFCRMRVDEGRRSPSGRARRSGTAPRRAAGGPRRGPGSRGPADSPTRAPYDRRHVTKIKFGTDGWRAAIAEDFTFHNVRRCARGVAEYLAAERTADRGVVVCHDRRFASEHFARACVGPGRARHPLLHAARGGPHPGGQLLHPRDGGGRRDRDHGQPQPVDRQRLQGEGRCRRRGARDAGSHRGDHGRQPSRTSCRLAGTTPMPWPPAWSRPSTRIRASSSSWRASWTSSASGRRLAQSWSSRCTAPGLAGSRGCWARRAHHQRAAHRAQLLRRRQPRADPPQHRRLARGDPRWGADIGIAFDGDADRVGMATEEGVFVNQLQVYALLYWYLLEVRGQIGRPSTP